MWPTACLGVRTGVVPEGTNTKGSFLFGLPQFCGIVGQMLWVTGLTGEEGKFGLGLFPLSGEAYHNHGGGLDVCLVAGHPLFQPSHSYVYERQVSPNNSMSIHVLIVVEGTDLACITDTWMGELGGPDLTLSTWLLG